MEFTLRLQLCSCLSMNRVWVCWLTDHMFGVSSRAVSKYALGESALERRVWIAQLLKWMRKLERVRLCVAGETS